MRAATLRLLILLLAFTAPEAGAVSAQLTVLYNFTHGMGDAELPLASLTLGNDGNFYGTSSGGGAVRGGTVFRITPAGIETVLYSFGTDPTDGVYPKAPLLLASDGFFYGTALTGGGPKNGGTVFRISPVGGHLKLYTFQDRTHDTGDGYLPYGGLLEGRDGNLYGTTSDGGPYIFTDNFGGTVYRISKLGSYAQLYAFGITPDDGQFLTSALVQDADGNIFGTTFESGPRGSLGNVVGGGTFFRLNGDNTVSTLYNFNRVGACGDDGGGPWGSLMRGADGNFYGTTRDGGSYRRGTIFRITPDGHETVLYSFGSIPNDGREPWSELVQLADGSLAGTTEHGGEYESDASWGGTAFMLAPDGTYTRLHSFGATPTDGQDIYAGLTLGADGNLYGVTTSGGTSADRANEFRGAGTVFKLVLDRSGTAPSFHSVPRVCTAKPRVDDTATGSGGGGAFGASLLLGMLPGLVALWRRRGPAMSRTGHSSRTVIGD